MLTPSERYQSTDMYRTLVSTKTISANDKHESFKFIPNHTKTGSTWDARHLDKFINSNWGTKTPTVLESRGLYTPRSGINESTRVKPGSIQSTRSLTSTKLKSTLKLSMERDDAYITNSAKDFTVKETKYNTNNLITLAKHDQKTLESHYFKQFPSLEKTYKPEQLEFSAQPIAFSNPKDRLNELNAVKKNQKDLHEWKEKQKAITKKRRVYTAGFKSGIMGIDNPLNSETLLYKEQYENITKAQQSIKDIEKRRLSQLQDWTGTNHMIEFFNRDFEKTTTLPPRQIVSRNARKLVSMEHTDKWKNSGERLFAPIKEAHSPERARYLQTQENKGRDWNILSLGKIDYEPVKSVLGDKNT